MTVKHFLDLSEVPAKDLRRIINAARQMKAAGKRPPAKYTPKKIEDSVLGMIFEKPSTRTRVSFDVAMRQLGGQSIMLNHTDLQLGRGESIADTARVLSRYLDIIMIRAHAHATLLSLAEYATVPVVNGLTDISHPCQVMADIMTFDWSDQGAHGGLDRRWQQRGGLLDACRRAVRLLASHRLPGRAQAAGRRHRMGA